MREFSGYEKILQEEIQELLSLNKPIILFGTLAMGNFAKKALEFLGLKPVCFCDNEEEKQGETVDGLIVLSPEQAITTYPNARIYICSFNKEHSKIIEQQLKTLKFNDIGFNDMLLYVYQTKVTKRPISSSDLANTMYNLNNKEGKIVLSTVSVVLTTKCNLKCKNCAALMPYFKKPMHYDKETIINSVKAFAEASDAIECLSLFGGEPLLHPDLAEICNEVLKIKNILRVLIITNGRVNLSADSVRSLKKSTAYFIMSHYVGLSNKKNELKAIADNNDIYIEIFDRKSKWTDLGDLAPRGRSNEELKDIFRGCLRSSGLPLLINGEYHLCSRSAFGTALGAIPKNDKEYINLFDANLSRNELRKSVKGLLNRTEPIAGCDYCDAMYEKEVEPAIQTNEVLNF